MSWNRRDALVGGLTLSAAAGLARSKPASAADEVAAADPTHILRHYVFANQTMAQLQQARAELKMKADISSSEPHHLGSLGFSTSMAMVGKTTIELVAPDAGGVRPKVDAFISERGAPGIYKLVLQTFDASSLRRRLYASKVPLERDEQFWGQEMIVMEPDMFGASFETYQYQPLSEWWGHQWHRALPTSSLVEDVAGCEVLAPNPGIVSRFLAHLYNAELVGDGSVVRFQPNSTMQFGAHEVRFSEPADGRAGVECVNLRAREPKRAGESFKIFSTEFRLV